MKNNSLEKQENSDPIEFETISLKKKELENIRQTKMEGIYIRSRAKWINEGETINNYFCKFY